MNPSSNETPGLNLPAPLSEQAPGLNVSQGEAGQQVPEAGSVAENASRAEAVDGVAAAYTVPLPQGNGITQSIDDSVTTQSVAQATTTDSDLIDKSIVDKAKAIIERNKDDPHKQTEELTVFKADHLYNNYNRKLKTKS